jgi:hypothetical protein
MGAASITRRALARAVLAGGAAVVAILIARDCENRAHDVTIVVDPRPMGEGVQAIRVDLFDQSGERGSIERRYRPGEERAPVRMRAAPPGAGGEIYIEVDTDDGMRRLRRPIEAPAGSEIKLRLGEGDVR